MGFPGDSVIKNLPVNGRRCRSGFNLRVRKIYLEEEVATHSNTLGWEIPWTEELGRLQSIESQRVGHDSASEHALTYFTTITKERGKGGLFRLRNFSTEKGHLNVPKDSVTICILGSQAYLSVPALYYMMKNICSFRIFHGTLERCFVTLHH